nr:MAG TPA: hypothetical protein [Caudoviricetes sp.]
MLANREREKKKTAPFFSLFLPPYNPLSITPYNPPEKKEKERARWGRRRRIGRLYLGERW